MTARRVSLAVVALAFAVALAVLWERLAGGIYLYSLPGGGWVHALERADAGLWLRRWRAGDPADHHALAAAAISAAWPIAILAGLAFVMGLRSAVPMFRRSVHGDARWATRREIKRAGLLDGQGVVAGRVGRFGPVVTMPVHTALRAQTGDGKGVAVVIPTLMSWAGSAVVTDIKGENRAITSGYRARAGQEVYVWSPFAPDGRSHGWNVFDELPVEPHRRVSEIMATASRFYSAADPTWTPSARNLFVACALLIDESPGEHLSVGAVLREGTGRGRSPHDHLLARLRARNYRQRDTGEIGRDGKPILEWVRIMKWDGKDLAPLSDACADAIETFTGIGDNRMSQSIVGTFVAALSLWNSPVVQAATERSDFSLHDLRRRPITLYVEIPPSKIAAAAPLVGPFLAALVDALANDLHDGKVPVLPLGDELARFGFQPAVETAPSYLRGYGVLWTTIIQSDHQLDALPPRGYGPASAKAYLHDHPAKLGFAPTDVEDANALSAFLGDTTIESVSRSAALLGAGGSISDQKRALMLPQELMRLSKHAVIVRVRTAHMNLRPFIVRKLYYYRDRDILARLASVAPSLARVPWWRRPTKRELDAAVESGELSIIVPRLTLPPTRRGEVAVEAVRPMRAADAPHDGPPVDLARVDVLGIDDLPTLDAEPPIDDAAVAAIVDGLWSALDAADPEPGDVSDDDAPGISLMKLAPAEEAPNAHES